MGAIDGPLVGVDSQGTAIAGDGALEAVFEARELLVPVELAVGNEAGVVVEEGEEDSLALGGWVGRVGELRAVHGVGLPQVAEVAALEAAEDSVGFEQAKGRRSPDGQLTTQSARGDVLFGDGAGPVE